jgi:hypothetical protein
MIRVAFAPCNQPLGIDHIATAEPIVYADLAERQSTQQAL